MKAFKLGARCGIKKTSKKGKVYGMTRGHCKKSSTCPPKFRFASRNCKMYGTKKKWNAVRNKK